MRQIAVLTQYKSHSLDQYISLTWRMSTMLGNYVTPVPAQQRLGPRWYQGSADAIFQSMNLIRDEDPDYVVVFGADTTHGHHPAGDALRREVVKITSDLKRASIIKQSTDPQKLANRVVVDVTG
jgi:hypothetical protein